eukprot:gene1597-1937_t
MSPLSTSSSGSETHTAVSSDGVSQPGLHHHAVHRHQHKQDSRANPGIQQSYCASQEWLYRLVTFPAYFTPCRTCCTGSRTPKREQLMTHFEIQAPYRVYCSHCPEYTARGGAGLLQVRRSSFKNVVNANDIVRFGADTTGVQHYTLNSNKVIYLSREQMPDKKSNSATVPPSMCVVDGRAMMDKSSQYCSLKCKMQAEDAGFTYWLNSQDPSVRIAAEVAANAPPRPTVACKRSATTTSCDSTPTAAVAAEAQHLNGLSGRHAKKLATIRINTGIHTVGSRAGSDEPVSITASGPVGPEVSSQHQQLLQRAVSAPVPGAFGIGSSAATTVAAAPPGAACVSGTPAGLRPIRTSLTAPVPVPTAGGLHAGGVVTASRQQTAPPGCLDAVALPPLYDGVVGLGDPAEHKGPGLAGGSSCGGSWGTGFDIESDLSSNGPWEQWDAPALPAALSAGLSYDQLPYETLDQQSFGDGTLSPPALISTGQHGNSLGCNWWLSSSPGAGVFGSGGVF